jgi:hypothetical protein
VNSPVVVHSVSVALSSKLPRWIDPMPNLARMVSMVWSKSLSRSFVLSSKRLPCEIGLRVNFVTPTPRSRTGINSLDNERSNRSAAAFQMMFVRFVASAKVVDRVRVRKSDERILMSMVLPQIPSWRNRPAKWSTRSSKQTRRLPRSLEKRCRRDCKGS